MAFIATGIKGMLARAVYDDRSLSQALRLARTLVNGSGGYVASLHDLLSFCNYNPFASEIWTMRYTVSSEEDVVRTPQGNSVVVVTHGGCKLSVPERIEKARRVGLTLEYTAKLSNSEVLDILNGIGIEPDGIRHPVYTIDEIISGALPRERTYSILLDFDKACETVSGYQDVEGLYANPLFIARAGGVAQARLFLDRVKEKVMIRRQESSSDQQRMIEFGQWHHFDRIDKTQSQGRLLFAGKGGSIGLLGDDDNVDYSTRVLGVAPEAHFFVLEDLITKTFSYLTSSQTPTEETIRRYLIAHPDFIQRYLAETQPHSQPVRQKGDVPPPGGPRLIEMD